MGDRDPTLGELMVMLSSMRDTLSVVSRTMVTTDVFNMWRDGNNERVDRLEKALEKWTEVSTKAHVELAAKTDALERDFRRELKETQDQALADKNEMRERQDANEAAVKSTKNGRINVWLAAGLALVGSLAIAVWKSFQGLQ